MSDQVQLTQQQKEALERKWLQGQHEHGSTRGVSLEEFVATVYQPAYADGSIMVEWCGMTLGIEPDGYTHS